MDKKYAFLRALLILIPLVLLQGIVGVIVIIVLGYSPLNYYEVIRVEHDFWLIFYMFLANIVVVFFFVKNIDKESIVDIGFSLRKRGWDILYGLLFGFVVMGIGFGLLVYLDEIQVIGYSIVPNNLLYTVLFFLVIALNEEILFRGYILRNFMYSMNKYLALFLSAIYFSIAHGLNTNYDIMSFISLIFAGLVLGISYIYTKNLWLPIAVHFSWNLFQTLFGFNVSGSNHISILETSFKEANLLNGGSFGFEGSVLSIIASVILIAIVMYNNRNKLSWRKYSPHQ